jgi:hypothetical protein
MLTWDVVGKLSEEMSSGEENAWGRIDERVRRAYSVAPIGEAALVSLSALARL